MNTGFFTLSGITSLVPFIVSTLTHFLSDAVIYALLMMVLPIVFVKVVALQFTGRVVVSSLMPQKITVANGDYARFDKLLKEINKDRYVNNILFDKRAYLLSIVDSQQALDSVMGNTKYDLENLSIKERRVIHAILNQPNVNGSTRADKDFKLTLRFLFPNLVIDADSSRILRRQVARTDLTIDEPNREAVRSTRVSVSAPLEEGLWRSGYGSSFDSRSVNSNSAAETELVSYSC